MAMRRKSWIRTHILQCSVVVFSIGGDFSSIVGTANDRASLSVHPNAIDLTIRGGDRHIFFLPAALIVPIIKKSTINTVSD